MFEYSNNFNQLLKEIEKANHITFKGEELLISKREMPDLEYLESIGEGPNYNEKEDRQYAWREYTLKNKPKVSNKIESFLEIGNTSSIEIKRINNLFDLCFSEILTSVYFYDYELNTKDNYRKLTICKSGTNVYLYFKFLIFKIHEKLVLDYLIERNKEITNGNNRTLNYLLKYTNSHADVGFKDIGNFLCIFDIIICESKNEVNYVLKTCNETYTSFEFIITFNENSIFVNPTNHSS